MPFGRIYLDSNVFISVAASEDSEISAAISEFSRAAVSSPTFATSELTLSEVLVHPFRFDDQILAMQYEALVSERRWLRVVPVARDILIEAAALRARNTHLKLPDAIHISTALLSACTHILTADLRLRDRYDSRSEDVALDVIRPTSDVLDQIRSWLRA